MKAYSPGVAEPSSVIAKDPAQVNFLTSRGNLVAVISNGTAVLGLGNIGPLAAKPVMEGKAVLFKKFGGIDSFDLEINQSDPDKFIDIVAALEPTFGGINLEDIKSPECFYIEEELSKRMAIPVFHDDQHGTAIIVCAAVMNALFIQNKKIEDVKLVCNGAGAAAIACLVLLVEMGLKNENIVMFDRTGCVYKGREGLDQYKKSFATSRGNMSLAESLEGADIFLGLSVANILSADMVKSMASSPLILALSNPEPEVSPLLVKSVRDDAIMATGRSDYPNQVNNVLCFPFLFRGALDVGARAINTPMKMAAVHAIAAIARAESSDIVSTAYGGEIHQFGPEYIIPKPFDPRLYVDVSKAVAKAAIESGVAERPYESEGAYDNQLKDFIYRSNSVMREVFRQAKEPRTILPRLVFSEGESRRVLQVAQMLVDEKMARPILIGRPDVIQSRMKALGLRFALGDDVEVTDPNDDNRFYKYWTTYHALMERKGITKDIAKYYVRTRYAIIAALMLYLKDADGIVSGTMGRFLKHFHYINDILGDNDTKLTCATVSGLIVEGKPLFISDTHLSGVDPSPERLADITLKAVAQVRHFGVEPKVALVSHSNFGNSPSITAQKMRSVLKILDDCGVDFEVDGEMQAHYAMNPKLREHILSETRLNGAANLLIAPNVDAANIAFNLAKSLGNFLELGPILMGLDYPVQIVSPAVTTRGLFNMASLAVAQIKNKMR